MNKKLINMCIMVVVMIFMVGAVSYATDLKSGVKEMTLNEAIKYAADHNTRIRDLNDQCDDMLKTYNDMVTKTLRVKNIPNKVNFYSMDEYALYKGYTLEKSKNTYNELLKSKELAEQITYYNIEKLAYDVDETGNDIDYLKKTKTKLEKDLAIAKLKLKLEMINQTQVDQASTALAQINTKIKLMEEALKAKKNAIKLCLGIDRTVTLKIKLDKKEYKEVGEINIEELKKQAAENRLDAVTLNDLLEAKKMDFDLYDYFRSSLSYDDYKDKQDDYNKAKDDYEDNMKDIVQKVEDAYEAVLTSEKQYNDALGAFKNSAETHRINKLKYSMGMTSSVDLMNSELSYMSAEIDLKKVLDKNILAKEKFAASYTIGELEVTAN